MKKKLKFLLIAVIGTVSITTLTLTSLGLINLFWDQYYQNFSDSGTTGRPNLLEEVHNITLKIEFKNTPTEIWENFSLFDFKTTVLDALEEKCSVETKTYGIGILVIGINGANGNWLYFVNDQYAGVAANNFKLSDGDYIHWKQI